VNEENVSVLFVKMKRKVQEFLIFLFFYFVIAQQPIEDECPEIVIDEKLDISNEMVGHKLVSLK
jgi:hypothetical protein